ncbi:MAG: hypothetical protein ACN6O2_01350 [Stenotrophomonas sp.]
MSENEIKPVAWRYQETTGLDEAWIECIGDFIPPWNTRDQRPLYDQQAIDRLTAEREVMIAERDRIAVEATELAAQLDRTEAELDAALASRDRYWDERNEAQRKLSVAVAEGKGLVADAERYRWLRRSRLGPQRAVFLDAETTDQLDAAIDAARAEGGV